MPRSNYKSISDDHLLDSTIGVTKTHLSVDQRVSKVASAETHPNPNYPDFSQHEEEQFSQSQQNQQLEEGNKQVQSRRSGSINIRSEHLDVQLIKYLYKVYFNRKILRNEMRSRMAGGEKRSQSLLRVTYFDDFDLFKTENNEETNLQSVNQPKKSIKSTAAATRAASTNDLDLNVGESPPSTMTVQQKLLSPPAQSGQVSSELSHGSFKTLTQTTLAKTSISSSEQFVSGQSQLDDEAKVTESRDRITSGGMKDGVFSSRHHSSNSSVIVLSGKDVDLDFDTDLNPDDDLIDDSSLQAVDTIVDYEEDQQETLQDTSRPPITPTPEILPDTSTSVIMTVASSVENVDPNCGGGDLLSASTVKVQLERAKDTSFGICIVGGQVNLSGSNKIVGVFIKNIIPNSPADKSGLLQIGDRILKVDDTNLQDSTHQYAVSVIKNAGLTIHLVVERFNKWQNDIFNVCDGDDKGLTLDKCHPPPVTPSKTPDCVIVQGHDKARSPSPTPSAASIPKEAAAAACEAAPPTPSPSPQLPTPVPVQIQSNNNDDNAKEIDNSLEKEAFDGKETIIKLTDREDNEKEKEQDGKTNSGPISSNNKEDESNDESSSDDEDIRDMTGRTYTKAGLEAQQQSRKIISTSSVPTTNTIDRASAGNVKLNKSEMAKGEENEDEFGYTNMKLKKRYGALGTIVQHTMHRHGKGGGTMGISLAGHRDRNKMACFIAGINPRGMAAGTELRVGDEILEVNGIVLHGRSHLNASAIIKTLPGPSIKFILLRKDREKALEELAVKPVTQFPIDLDSEAEAIATNFKNVRTISMQKAGPSLGIMIIEGKHSEVGQGIFVSDIQEQSVAERAGLCVGDMILSVNGDSLIGCNYEAAAGTLKKTDGIVTLKVCNPNRKEAVEETGKDDLKVNESLSNSNSKKSLDKPTPADDRKSLNLSQPVTPKSHKSNKELVSNEICKEISANKESIIEINAEKKMLGLICVGGKGSHIKSGATVIVRILKEGSAFKDGRLKVFDQLLEINGVKLTGVKTPESIQKTLKMINDKINLTVWRSEPPETETIDLELPKKSGKDLGLCLSDENGHGVVVSDVLAGSVADADGRIQKGDIISHVNGDSLANQPIDLCSVLLKTGQGRIQLKVLRPAPKPHQ